MSENILLISDKMIKDRTTIHGNIDPKLIYSDIKVAQDMYILPILGTALYDKIQSIVDDGSIQNTENAPYKILMDKYLVDALIYYTLSELPTTISYQFWNKGIVRKNGQDTELPSMSELIDLSYKYKNRAEFYANRMKLFIIDQSSRLGLYKEYLLPGNTVDTITPEQRNYTMPVYLGDEYDSPYCNRGGFTGQPYKE